MSRGQVRFVLLVCSLVMLFCGDCGEVFSVSTTGGVVGTEVVLRGSGIPTDVSRRELPGHLTSDDFSPLCGVSVIPFSLCTGVPGKDIRGVVSVLTYASSDVSLTAEKGMVFFKQAL